jgi:uncharacterized protein DUF4136
MPLLLRFAMTILFAGTLTACATSMTVSSHVEHDLDLSRFRTFDWGPADALPAEDARLAENPVFKDHVQGAVEKGLAARGFQLIASGETADLLIHYHANISPRINVNHADRAYGYCSQADCPPDLVEHEAGTLVLDVVDARTNKLVWRGWAQTSVEDMLHKPDVMAKTIDEIIARILFRLPPRL